MSDRRKMSPQIYAWAKSLDAEQLALLTAVFVGAIGSHAIANKNDELDDACVDFAAVLHRSFAGVPPPPPKRKRAGV